MSRFVWLDQFTCQSLIDFSIISAGCKPAQCCNTWNLKPWIYSQLNRLPILQDVVKCIIEVLVCRRDTRDRYDLFTVATCKGTTVVRYVKH